VIHRGKSGPHQLHDLCTRYRHLLPYLATLTCQVPSLVTWHYSPVRYRHVLPYLTVLTSAKEVIFCHGLFVGLSISVIGEFSLNFARIIVIFSTMCIGSLFSCGNIICNGK